MVGDDLGLRRRALWIVAQVFGGAFVQRRRLLSRLS
jgi:hypothetical protein